MSLLRLLLAALATCCMAVAATAAIGPGGPGTGLDARTGAAPLVLLPWMSLLEDPGGQWRLEDVRAPALAERFEPAPSTGEAVNFGLTPSAWWLRLRIDNPGDAALERLLEVAYARLSHLSLFAPMPDGSYREVRTGTRAPFESRGYAHRHFVFPLDLPPGSEQTLYLRVASTTAFIVPARLWEPAAFHAYERRDYAAQAGYFGAAAAMVLFNLLLFLRLKDSLYLLYCGFATSMAFALAAQNGLVKEVLRLQSPVWSDLCTSFGYSFALATGMLFMRRLLETARVLPRADPWLKAFVAFFLFSPFLFVVSGQLLIPSAAVAYLLAMLTLMGVAAVCALRRQRSAYFFLAAFAMLALGALTNVLRAMGILPSNLLTSNAMQVGSAIEMLLLALALADRFNQVRRDKDALNVELLSTQEALIETLRSNELRLEQHVQDRTRALHEINQRLEALSLTDGMTGIANRRRFDASLAAEWSRAQRSGQPVALAMLDLDWFKAYNDHFGHLAGDDCLRSLAAVLENCAARASDVVARYGGEEFAIIAPGSDAAGMLALWQRIQKGLAEQALPHPTTPSGLVTLSMGIAVRTPQIGESPELLVADADRALYEAKAQGRDRAVVAGENSDKKGS